MFDEGAPQEWVNTQRDILEVRTQNSLNAPDDRMAIVRAVLRGETLTTLDAALADLRMDADGNVLELTMDMVTATVAEVTKTNFSN